MIDVSAPTTSSCGVRTNWRSVRPANVAAVAATPARLVGRASRVDVKSTSALKVSGIIVMVMAVAPGT